MSSNIKFLGGWVPDLPDQRDLTFKIVRPKKFVLPTSVNLAENFPEVFDQGELGSCTANAVSSLITYHRMMVEKPHDIYSRLFIYYNVRVLSNTVNRDSGATLRDCIKVVAKQGAAPETIWPYIIEKYKIRPNSKAYTLALPQKVIGYERVPQTLTTFKMALATGKPFVFGFTVYENFMSEKVAKTGVLTMPSKQEKALGGHAVVCVGYDDAKKQFIVRNSWGPDWGKKGHFRMPYEYLLNSQLADDFWSITV